MKNAIGFYKSILASMRYSCDNDGYISIEGPSGVFTPAIVNGKRLVLPTAAWLKKGFGDGYQPFHPLSETLARLGTSPVLKHMQKNARAQITNTYILLATRLMEVASDSSNQTDLPPKTSALLKPLTGADRKTIELLSKLLNKALAKNELLSFYLKKGGTFKGSKVNRCAVLRFILKENLDKLVDSSFPVKLYGVELNSKQFKTIHSCLSIVLPETDYSEGSNKRIAPYLHAFLKAYGKVIKDLNVTLKRLGDPFDPYPEFDEDQLDDFANLEREIPSLGGNVGEVDEEEQEVSNSPKRDVVTIEAETVSDDEDSDSVSFSSLKKQWQGGVAQAPVQPVPNYLNPYPQQVQPSVNNPYAAVISGRQMVANTPIAPPRPPRNALL